jgi:hypothetical protein
MPDKSNDITQRIERILCWSLVEFPRPDEPDEVIGQIIVGDTVTEVTNVDEEEGFGEFIGYFQTEESATTAIMTLVAQEEAKEEEGDDGDDEEGEDEDDEDDDEDDDDDDWDEDEDEDEGEEDDDDDDDDDEDDDEDDKDEDDED